MNPRCIQQVQAAAAAAGRKALTDTQIAAIDDRLNATMRRLAYSEPGWQGLSTDQRVMLAAERAAADIQGEAQRKVENAQRQVVATAATESRVDQLQRAYGSNRTTATVNDVRLTQNYIDAIRGESMSHLMDLVDSAKSGEGASAGRRLSMFLFDTDNQAMTRALATEIFRNADGSSGSKAAQAGAKAYLEAIEGMRQRFNAAGGDVRRLDYGYVPQPHDAARVRGAGVDAWAASTLPRLDRARYLREDGSRMSDAETLDFLRASWETISTEGLNKQEPGSFRGEGARANRGGESRQIHFKDSDAYLDYLSEYGRGGMYDAILGHVGGMSRNIGLLERYGPNPNAQMRLQFDLAERADGGRKRVDGIRPEQYWNLVNGTTGAAENANIAQIANDVRNVQTMGKLAGAVLSSVTDLGTYVVTTGYNRLPYWDSIRNAGLAATSEGRDFMNTHGMIAESMAGDLNRWSSGTLRQNWSGRLANSTMKLSLMNAWTDTLRRGFQISMMKGMARLAKTDWNALDAWDRTHMERKGITADDWSVIRQADLTSFRGGDYLTPGAIRATGDARSNELVAKVLGLISDESEYAVINPDLTTRAWISGGLQRGTVKGELARSVMQFKSFPIAMITRHWRRIIDMPPNADGSPAVLDRVAYAGALLVSTTALGAIALQEKQVVQGKDPIDMTGDKGVKFWFKAMAAGGGGAFVADMLLADTTQDRGNLDTFARIFLGPSFGTAADVWGLTKGNIDQVAAGKDSHAGAEAIKFARSHTPMVNLWYAKAALDHAGMNALQENLSPGYLTRTQQRARKDWGQDYWWAPREDSPRRAPDMAGAFGQ